MSDDNTQRAIGTLESSIKSLSEQHSLARKEQREEQSLARKEQREDMRRIYERLENISTFGCAVGNRNTQAIEELQKRPERIIGIGAALIAILSAVGSLFLWMNERMR